MLYLAHAQQTLNYSPIFSVLVVKMTFILSDKYCYCTISFPHVIVSEIRYYIRK
jgi:hypothetical protein